MFPIFANFCKLPVSLSILFIDAVLIVRVASPTSLICFDILANPIPPCKDSFNFKRELDNKSIPSTAAFESDDICNSNDSIASDIFV